YREFDATVEFPQLRERARLAGGAAFLVKDGKEPVDWRQLHFWVSDQNMRHVPPDPMVENKLRGVRMDPGDVLLLILDFYAAPGNEMAAIPPADFQAALRMNPAP